MKRCSSMSVERLWVLVGIAALLAIAAFGVEFTHIQHWLAVHTGTVNEVGPLLRLLVAASALTSARSRWSPLSASASTRASARRTATRRAAGASGTTRSKGRRTTSARSTTPTSPRVARPTSRSSSTAAVPRPRQPASRSTRPDLAPRARLALRIVGAAPAARQRTSASAAERLARANQRMTPWT